MMRKLIPALLMLALLAAGVHLGLAQSASNVQIFVVICDTSAVINLSGTMEAGFDLLYQVYSGPGGTGTPLTSIRQVQVDGQYAFSEQISYVGGTVAAGAVGSVKVSIVRTGTTTFSADTFTVDDVQDGCNAPQNPLGASVDAGSAAPVTTVGGSNILSPFGGVINPGQTVTPEPIVVIGPRTTVAAGRSLTPGVIFAECNQYLPGAAPGVLYDSDNIVIFWSWFARTEQQVQDYIAQAVHEVSLNRAPLVYVDVSPIQQRTRNYWVFYTANIGHLAPGNYGVEFKLSWNEPISDGFDDFGPGTDNERVNSTCNFTIERNPDGIRVTDYNLMYSLR